MNRHRTGIIDGQEDLPEAARALLLRGRVLAAGDDARADRVRWALRAHLASGHRQRRRSGRVGVLAAVGLLLAGAASAAVYVQKTRIVAPSPPASEAKRRPKPPAPVVAASSPVAPMAPEDVVAVAESPKPTRGQAEMRRSSSKGGAQPEAARAEAAPPAEPSIAESRLLLQAVSALRRQGQPAEARKLAARYQRQYPEGVLQEEARALELEAAAQARHEDAPELARAYLATFPQGRFAPLARKLLTPAP